MKNTIAGVDLAKEVIQVCICTKNKVHSHTEMSHRNEGAKRRNEG